MCYRSLCNQGDVGQSCAHMAALYCFHVKSKEHTAARKRKSIISQKIKQQFHLVWSAAFTPCVQTRCKGQGSQTSFTLYPHSKQIMTKKGRGHCHLLSSNLERVWREKVHSLLLLNQLEWLATNLGHFCNTTHSPGKHLVVWYQYSLIRVVWVTS